MILYILEAIRQEELSRSIHLSVELEEVLARLLVRLDPPVLDLLLLQLSTIERGTVWK